VAVELRPYAIGLIGALIWFLAHGIVDHTFFLIDLAYVFYLLLGMAVWLDMNRVDSKSTS
jgi:hypothetical protein